jgi:type IV secretory pathway protease TraF
LVCHELQKLYLTYHTNEMTLRSAVPCRWTPLPYCARRRHATFVDPAQRRVAARYGTAVFSTAVLTGLQVICGFVVGRQLIAPLVPITRIEGPSMEPTLFQGDVILGCPVWLWLPITAVADNTRGLLHRITPQFPFSSKVGGSNNPFGQPSATSSRDESALKGSVVVFALDPAVAYCKRVASVMQPDTAAPAVRDTQLYVLGDNLPRSRDSRDFGPVPLAAVSHVAVAVFRRDAWYMPSRVR